MGAERRVRECALMKLAFGLAPFHQHRPPPPRPGKHFRLDRSDPLLSLLFFFASHGSVSLLCPVPSPFPSTDGPEGERLPLALWPADGKGFLTSPLPPAWRLPACRFEILQMAILLALFSWLCTSAWAPVRSFVATSYPVLPV